MVECQLPKLDVVGSNPISRSIFSTTWEHSWKPSLLRLLLFLFPVLFWPFIPLTFAIVLEHGGTCAGPGIVYWTAFVSKRRTAAKRSSKLLIAYSFSLTFTVLPIWAERV